MFASAPPNMSGSSVNNTPRHWFSILPPNHDMRSLSLSGRRLKNQAPTRCRSHLGEGSEPFFESAVVRTEMDRLKSDYKSMLHLGRNFGRFDKEGKLRYIQEMRTLIERWHIFYKRMELSDDFVARLCAKQMKTEVGPLGLSNVDLVQSFYAALDEMKQDAEASPL